MGELRHGFRTSTLIEWLQITPAEERELTTIISTEKKYWRNNERRRKQRGDKCQGGGQGGRSFRARPSTSTHAYSHPLSRIPVFGPWGRVTPERRD